MEAIRYTNGIADQITQQSILFRTWKHPPSNIKKRVEVKGLSSLGMRNRNKTGRIRGSGKTGSVFPYLLKV